MSFFTIFTSTNLQTPFYWSFFVADASFQVICRPVKGTVLKKYVLLSQLS